MRPAPVPSLRPSGPFQLGEWTVRPERNLLETSDDSHHLEPKVMDALLLLVDRGGEVVTKDDLIDGVWEGRIISEGTITNTIAELRSALGDDARSPTYIETIPKRGYRLICPVEEISADVSDVEVTGGTRRRWMAVGIVMVVCVMCVAVVAMVMRSRPRSLDPKVVLVAPFDNRTGDARLDPLSILARDRIVSQLSGSGIARPVVAGADFASTSLDELCDLARSKGAGLSMTGALYLHEGDVEVQAQLVDVTEGELLYAVPAVTGSTAHAAGALDEVIQRGLGALATHLHAHAHSNLLSRPPVFAAYREFLAGSELFGRDLPAAIRHLRTATEIDPDFTSAAIRLAMALRATRRGEEGRAIMDGLEERRAELTEFERLWVDSFIADFEGRYVDSLDALYSIERLVPSDWTVVYLIAGRELKLNRPRRAIAAFDELHTHSAELPDMVKRTTQFIGSYQRLAGAWHMIGDHESELEAARDGRMSYPAEHRLMVAEAKALAALGDRAGLDATIAEAMATPMGWTPANVLVEAAATAGAHGRPELSRILADRAVRIFETGSEASVGPWDRILFAEALVHLGQLERAQVILEDLLPEVRQRPGSVPLVVRGWLGTVAARRGDLETARSTDRELADMEDPYLYGGPLYYRAAITAWLGHREEAIELLQAARSEGWSAYYQLHDEDRVLFEPLEGMAGYEEMLHPTG